MIVFFAVVAVIVNYEITKHIAHFSGECIASSDQCDLYTSMPNAWDNIEI